MSINCMKLTLSLFLSNRGKDFFGYSKKDLFGRSSYVMVHRADLQHLRCKHTESRSHVISILIPKWAIHGGSAWGNDNRDNGASC